MANCRSHASLKEQSRKIFSVGEYVTAYNIYITYMCVYIIHMCYIVIDNISHYKLLHIIYTHIYTDTYTNINTA